MKGPLFSFYGAKWRAAPLYDKPRSRIVELFAGSACYSCRYPDRQVLLVERDPLIAALWRWLIAASPAEVRALPDLEADVCADDLQVCEEARALIGFTMCSGANAPRKTFTARHRNPIAPRFDARNWWARQREQTAQGVAEIKHWKIFEGDWFDAPPVTDATWFVDPPYQKAGKYYKHSAVDFALLASECSALKAMGEHLIVCEAEGADWLPFVPLAKVKASSRAGGRYSHEVVWPGSLTSSGVYNP